MILNYEEHKLPTTSQEKKKFIIKKKGYVLLKMESNLIFENQCKKEKKKHPKKTNAKVKITLKNERKKRKKRKFINYHNKMYAINNLTISTM